MFISWTHYKHGIVLLRLKRNSQERTINIRWCNWKRTKPNWCSGTRTISGSNTIPHSSSRNEIVSIKNHSKNTLKMWNVWTVVISYSKVVLSHSITPLRNKSLPGTVALSFFEWDYISGTCTTSGSFVWSLIKITWKHCERSKVWKFLKSGFRTVSLLLRIWQYRNFSVECYRRINEYEPGSSFIFTYATREPIHSMVHWALLWC